MSDGASAAAATSAPAAGANGGDSGQSTQASQAAATQAAKGEAVAEGSDAQQVSEKAQKAVTDVKAETTEVSEQPETKQEKELHKLKLKLKEKFKDKQFESDNDFFDAAHDELTNLETYKQENEKANENIWNMLDQHEELRSIFIDMDKGASFKEALARNVDLDGVTPMEDEPDFDAWQKAKEDRKKKTEDHKLFTKEYDSNIEKSIKNYETFAKERKWDDNSSKEFTGKVDAVMAELSKGIISNKFLTTMEKGLMYDEAVKDAAETGEIKGRNENIEAKREDNPKAGDGIPSLTNIGKTDNIEKAQEQEKVPDVWTQDLNKHLQRQRRAEGKLG